MTSKTESSLGMGTLLLRLARISNLPTVWSNVVAAWVLGGGSLSAPALPALLLGAALIYAAGCTLNDAWDVRWDQQHRPDRPIPSGAISARAVWLAGGLEMLAGLACILLAAPQSWLAALGLAGAILLYDAWHKQSALSVIIMGACRWLLYTTAGMAAGNAGPAMAGGVVLWIYIIVLSLIARGEATAGGETPRSRWLIGLVPLSLLVLAGVSGMLGFAMVMPGLMCAGIIAVLAGTMLPRPLRPGPVVNLMLAAIPLLDACVVAALTGWHVGLVWSVVGFILARAMQRWFQAT